MLGVESCAGCCPPGGLVLVSGTDFWGAHYGASADALRAREPLFSLFCMPLFRFFLKWEALLLCSVASNLDIRLRALWSWHLLAWNRACPSPAPDLGRNQCSVPHCTPWIICLSHALQGDREGEIQALISVYLPSQKSFSNGCVWRSELPLRSCLLLHN